MSADGIGRSLPDFDDVVDAAARLKGVSIETPLLRNAELDARVGCPVLVKAEPLQVTGTFKIRGAYNRLCSFSEAERARGAVAFSSGNHAQGVARAGRLLNIPTIIVMPSDSPKVKVEGVKNDGAEIVFYDRFTEDREEISKRISEERGCVVVPSFDDFHVIAGQGSCGLEISRQWPLDDAPGTLVCNVGGGGLLAGVTLAVRKAWPELAIWGVEPEGFDDHAISFQRGEICGHPPESRSICDALLSDRPGKLTFAINQPNVTRFVTVTDDEVREAMCFAFRHLKLVVEPGGAASLAALLAGRIEADKARPVVIILTGGNVDPGFMASVLSGS